MLKIFVYGTLKPGESNYQLYCADKVIQTTKAYTWGQLFHLPLGYPAMTLGKDQVEGFVLTFADTSVLESLDQLEGYDLERSPEENEYHRQKIRVYEPSGKPLGEAWSYLKTSNKVQQLKGIFLPSGRWMSRGGFIQ